MKKAILITLFASAIACFAPRLQAQIITSAAPFSFTSGEFAINIGDGSLYTGPYIGTDGGIHNDWVVSSYSEEGPQGLELQYANSAAQWLTGGPVTLGASVGPGGTYSGNFGTSRSSFSDLYYGLDFTVSPGNVEYGWAEFSFNTVSGTSTIVAAALDTNINEPITVGALQTVPEASTIGMLALAVSVFLIAQRKRISRA